MVLFLFVLMLMNLNTDTEPMKSTLLKVVGAISGGCLLVTLIGSMKTLSTASTTAMDNTGIGLVENLGKVLFSDFLLPFELSSILLLAAMVGAVLLAKRDNKTA